MTDTPTAPEPSLYERLGGQTGLSRLIKWFYAKVRYEPELEPIFKAHVHSWPEHIRVIIDFWAGMTGGPSTYRSGMGRHFRMKLQPAHFDMWLKVWDQNNRDLLPEREAGEMIALGHNLADDLQRMIARIEQAPKAAG